MDGDISNQIDSAVDFVIKEVDHKPIDLATVKQKVLLISDHAIKFGLSSNQIKLLSLRALQKPSYVPENPRSFPHEIVPILLSTVYPHALSYLISNTSWTTAILSWMMSLLRYGILRADDQSIRLCYLPCFNLMANSRLTRLCAEILSELTQRYDVTPSRIKVLNSLRKKTKFSQNLCKILRVYATMRPDLLILSGELLTLYVPEPVFRKQLKQGLDSCRQRSRTSDFENDGSLWKGVITRRHCINVYRAVSAIPAPKVVQYEATLESKRVERLNVLHCTKLSQLIAAIPSSETWIWPNNFATLLRTPILLLWFLPHHYHVEILLDSWLDHALTTEVLKPRAISVSSQRSSDLFRRVVAWSEQQQLVGKLCSPVSQQFLLSYLMTWDKQQHLDLVLRLVRCLGYIEPFFSVVLGHLQSLLVTEQLTVACAVIDTLTNTALNWCFYCDANRDALDEEAYVMLEGVLEMSRKLEPLLLGAVLHHALHPLIAHTVISFYTQVNACCDCLDLALVVCPSPVLTALLVSTGDLVLTHRLGLFFAQFQSAYDRLKKHLNARSRLSELCMEIARDTRQHNASVRLFCGAVYDSTVFSDKEGEDWTQLTVTFLGRRAVVDAKAVNGIQGAATAVRAIPCTALRLLATTNRFNNNSISVEDGEAQQEQIRDDVLQELKKLNLDGIQKCIEAYETTCTPSSSAALLKRVSSTS